jgi:FKBP-type peptidyl-prolyl cis-trans isomerase FkpA
MSTKKSKTGKPSQRHKPAHKSSQPPSKSHIITTREKRRASRQRQRQVIVGIGILMIVAVAALITYSIWSKSRASSGGNPNAETITTASGLQYQDLVIGTGAEAKTGDRVSVHYTGTLADGTKFDSSLDRNQPFELVLGAGGVIKGWEEGIPGMKVGGKRKLIIPPELGYGASGAGSAIPPNATLIFEIELLEIK